MFSNHLEEHPDELWHFEPTNSAGSPSRQGPRERGSRREAPAELLEIGTYNSAAHHTAHHIEVVGVGHVLHPRGHPPADGGVREFNSLFVERGLIFFFFFRPVGAPSRFERRERRVKSVKIRKIEIPKYSLFWIW